MQEKKIVSLMNCPCVNWTLLSFVRFLIILVLGQQSKNKTINTYGAKWKKKYIVLCDRETKKKTLKQFAIFFHRIGDIVLCNKLFYVFFFLSHSYPPTKYCIKSSKYFSIIIFYFFGSSLCFLFSFSFCVYYP